MYIEDYSSVSIVMKDLLRIIHGSVCNGETYFGVRTQKNPCDAWVYQEILYEYKPDVVIEIGNKYGGSTLMLAHLLDLIGKGRVIGIDRNQTIIDPKVRSHPRISLIQGNALKLVKDIEDQIKKDETVILIEDSAHTYEICLQILKLYCHLIKPGGWIIMEDSIMNNGLPKDPAYNPMKAIEEFVKNDLTFEIDRTKERFFITHNPKGYLHKKI